MPGTPLRDLRPRGNAHMDANDADAIEGGGAGIADFPAVRDAPNNATGDENEAGEDETTPLLRRNPRVQ